MKNDLNDGHHLKRIQRELEKLSRLFNAQGKDVIFKPPTMKAVFQATGLLVQGPKYTIFDQ